MFKSILKKEAIETAPATIGVVTVLLCMFDGYGMWNFPWFRDGWVPPWRMYNDFVPILVVFCAVMGLLQTLGESAQGTWGYLLTLPRARARLLTAKLVWGVVALALCTFIVLVFSSYAVARTNDNWATIIWKQQEPVFRCLVTVPIVYFGAFLSGLRPARFYGSRIFPVAGAAMLWFAILYLPNWWLTAVPATLLLCSVLVGLIFHEARRRHFA